jgi:hypothetical protein
MNVPQIMEAVPTLVRTHLEEQTASAPLVSCLEMTGSLVKVNNFTSFLWYETDKETQNYRN